MLDRVALAPAPHLVRLDAFNTSYAAVLAELGTTLDGMNPVARTNVVPTLDPPTEPVVRGLCFTVPRARSWPSIVIAGAAEVAGMSSEGTVRPGDTSPDALREKTEFVLALLADRLAGLEATRDELSTTHVYSGHGLGTDLWAEIGRAAGDREGSVRFHPALPPIKGLEREMDIRSVAQERRL